MVCVAGAVVFVSVEHPLVEIHEIALQVKGVGNYECRVSFNPNSTSRDFTQTLSGCLYVLS